MSIKALKLALEALEAYRPVIVKRHGLTYSVGDKAITALRQAIEQAEQAQPVAKIRTWHRNGMQHAELMDWGVEIESLPDGEYELHTAPPPRQPWVGLTKEEWFDFWDECEFVDGESVFPEFFELAQAIEAKLKEKNT
jgi:hypothetical protein